MLFALKGMLLLTDTHETHTHVCTDAGHIYQEWASFGFFMRVPVSALIKPHPLARYDFKCAVSRCFWFGPSLLYIFMKSIFFFNC